MDFGIEEQVGGVYPDDSAERLVVVGVLDVLGVYKESEWRGCGGFRGVCEDNSVAGGE